MASSSRIKIHNVVPLIDNEVFENMVSCCAIHSNCKYIRGKMDYGAKIEYDLCIGTYMCGAAGRRTRMRL